jgi:excisionase family DNA binding protein
MPKSITLNNRIALSLQEVAESIGVSVPFLRLEIQRGKLKAAHAGRRVLVRRDEIDRYLEGEGAAE